MNFGGGDGYERRNDDLPLFDGVIGTVCFDLDALMEVVHKGMAEEAKILGEED